MENIYQRGTTTTWTSCTHNNVTKWNFNSHLNSQLSKNGHICNQCGQSLEPWIFLMYLCSWVQTVQVDSRASAPLCTATRTDLVPPAAWRTHETLLETTVKHTGQALTQFKPTSLHWCIEDSSYEADLVFAVRRRIYNIMQMYLWNHHVSTWSSICSSNWLHSKSVFSQAASTISRSRVSLNREGSKNRCQNNADRADGPPTLPSQE